MIDVLSFFTNNNIGPYCVVKMSYRFPAYELGEDIDIFCYSLEDFTMKLLKWGKQCVGNGLKIRVKHVQKGKHVHVDIFDAEELQVRFDLYGKLPTYNKLQIKPALFESIIENAGPTRFKGKQEEVLVMVPSLVDEMLIRYLEFVEWYDVRPDKIKHLDYIMNNCDETTKNLFLSKLHHYTKLPPITIPPKDHTGLFQRVLRLINK